MSEQRQVAIGIQIDWKAQQVTFSEQEVNGIVTINPPSITVPLILLMRVAAEVMFQSMPPQVRAMQFTPPEPKEPDKKRDIALAFDSKLGPH